MIAYRGGSLTAPIRDYTLRVLCDRKPASRARWRIAIQFLRSTPLILLTVVLLPLNTEARNTFHDLEIKSALENPLADMKLLDVPFFFTGQTHPKVAKRLGTFTANKRTNAFNKSDEAACEIAFLSAIITFQRRAQSMGADAIVDMKSITKHNDLESPTQFRCLAGNVVANVALSGTVVKLGE